MFRIAVCSSQTNDKNETSRTIQKWIKRNITADAELCQVESVEELQNIMETQPDKYNFCIMDMPALKSAFEAQTEQKKHPLLIHGTDSIRHIFVEDIMYAENSLRRITYTLCYRDLLAVCHQDMICPQFGNVPELDKKRLVRLHKSLCLCNFPDCALETSRPPDTDDLLPVVQRVSDAPQGILCIHDIFHKNMSDRICPMDQ